MSIEPANSLQAVVFAAMFSGVVSMPEQAILVEFGVPKKDLVDNFQMGTETALGRANIIRTTKIETLQAFIMYMVGYFYADQEISSFQESSAHSCAYEPIYLASICTSLFPLAIYPSSTLYPSQLTRPP